MGEVFDKGHGGIQILVGYGVGHVGVHATGFAAAQGQGLELGDVAAVSYTHLAMWTSLVI